MNVDIGKMNTGRQWALIAMQEIDPAELAATVVTEAVHLPVGAIIVGGSVIVTEAFDGGVTLTLGGNTGATLAGPVDGTVLGRTPLVIDGSVNALGEAATLVMSGASVGGFGYLEIEYVRPGRANEVQE